MISTQPPDSSGTDAGSKATKDDLEGLRGETGSGKRLQIHEKSAPKASSWVDVAKEKKVLRKYDLDITNQEGHLNVEIPDEVVVNVNSLWEDFLIGKFLEPHIARVHAVVNKI